MRSSVSILLALSVGCWALFGPTCASAQGGPPYITNDPGTPGNANWEINLGSMQEVARGSAAYQIPQIDLNFGLGERIQLTYEVPYVVATSDGQPTQSGWGNGFPGVKWRFLDQGEGGWQISVFPQVETGLSAVSQQEGLGGPGPRYLLPVEVSKRIGPLDVDFEAGEYLPRHGPRERILGLVAGRQLTSRLELDAELYDDRAQGALPRDTTLDIGGRYKVHRGFIALFMFGRSVSGTASGEPHFMGYIGIQILLSHYGRTLIEEP